MKRSITFDKNAKEEVLGLFDKAVNQDGIIVEKNKPEQEVISPDGEKVRLEEFAGISKGSEVFIKSDLISLMRFSKKVK